MASLRFVYQGCRASSSLLRACQPCQCRVNINSGGTCVVAKRSLIHVANHISQPCGTAPSQRPFHSSRYSRSDKKDNSTALDATESISQLADQSTSDFLGKTSEQSNQTQLGESFTDVPGATNTKQKTLAIVYTCKVCDTRSAKQFTQHAYKHGVVLVRCPGCQNFHLIADRLGWFEDEGDDGVGEGGWDVQKVLAKAGENVKAVSGEDVLELTLEDVMGSKKT